MNALRRFLLLMFFTGSALAQRKPPGQVLFERNCMSCHSPESGAPPMAALKTIPADTIYYELTRGRMKDVVTGLTSRERRIVAVYLGTKQKTRFRNDRPASWHRVVDWRIR